MVYLIKLNVMARRFITLEENEVVYNMDDTSKVVTREPSLVDSFYTEENVCPDDGCATVVFTDPLVMLFNQERLSQMGDAAVKMWIDSMSAAKGSAMSELKSKLSDDELMDLVKSRHIQSPSELQAYAEWCNENVDEFTQQVQALQAQQLQSEQVDNSETKLE